MNTMNMNGIYAANAAKEYASVSERSTSKEPDYEKGQILEGIVSKISDTVSMQYRTPRKVKSVNFRSWMYRRIVLY